MACPVWPTALLRQMRRDRRHHAQVDILRLEPIPASARAQLTRFIHLVQQLHQTGDDRVELEILEIVRHPAQSLVQLAAQATLHFGSRGAELAGSVNSAQTRRTQRAEPSMPLLFHGPPISQRAKNIK